MLGHPAVVQLQTARPLQTDLDGVERVAHQGMSSTHSGSRSGLRAGSAILHHPRVRRVLRTVCTRDSRALGLRRGKTNVKPNKFRRVG